LASSAILKNPLSIASLGARWIGDLLKNCHLLPSTAISEPQNRFVRFNRSIRSLPLVGVPASLGPGLRTASGVERTLGEKLSPSAICPVTGESDNSQKMQLAAAIAKGTTVATEAMPRTPLIGRMETTAIAVLCFQGVFQRGDR
jgi:hypothetical protein